MSDIFTTEDIKAITKRLREHKIATGDLKLPVKNYQLLDAMIWAGRAKIENGVVVLLDVNGKAV